VIVVDVLLFDAAAATVDPSIVDIRDRQGTPISGYDAQIAAICRTHDALLATRNEKNFAGWALNSSIRGEPNSSAPPGRRAGDRWHFQQVVQKAAELRVAYPNGLRWEAASAARANHATIPAKTTVAKAGAHAAAPLRCSDPL